MDDRPAARPRAFTNLVRDALLHLYDLTALQTHPLAAHLVRQASGSPARGQQVRQALLGAIRSLHPGPGVATTSRAWRTYQLLELRYIEGLDVAAVSDQLALGRSHYHREHHRALQAVADSLWEQSPNRPTSEPAPPAASLVEQEAAALAPPAAAEPVDLAAIVADVCALLEPLCAQRGIVLGRAGPAAPVTVHADRVALRQVLLILAAPVIERLERGAVTVGLAVRDGWADVTVSGALAGDGSATPLAVDDVRPFVEAVRGQLAPLPDPDHPAAWGLRLTLPTGAGPQLLVVDNNADFIRLVERALSSYGWEVVGASDVAAALRSIERRRPRAILLDIVLPGHDGWELLLALKSAPATRPIPVIVCSVLGRPSVAIALGAAAYLQKPVDGPRLAAALGAYVDVEPAVR